MVGSTSSESERSGSRVASQTRPLQPDEVALRSFAKMRAVRAVRACGPSERANLHDVYALETTASPPMCCHSTRGNVRVVRCGPDLRLKPLEGGGREVDFGADARVASQTRPFHGPGVGDR